MENNIEDTSNNDVNVKKSYKKNKTEHEAVNAIESLNTLINDDEPNFANKKVKIKNKMKVKEVDTIESSNTLDHNLKTGNNVILEPINSNKGRKKNKAKFVVEDVNTEVPSKNSVNLPMFNNNTPKSNLKRKSILTDVQNAKKKKFDEKKKNKLFKKDFKKSNANNTDSLVQLSDGRLKAYGLNPKKYKKFMKYKKF